ncbi:MAG TPA: phage/plasmid primase, P4 family [Hanamia sp.]|nr:phage/plasmid primase, P4 family [Hanamia sp.]
MMQKQNLPSNDSFGEEQGKGKTNGKLSPKFDDSLLKRPEKFLSHKDKLLKNDKNSLREHKDILKKLLNELKPLDFISIVHPDLKELITELENIKNAYNEGNINLYEELNKPKGNDSKYRITEIESLLNEKRKKIKQKHYVVSIITELLKVAESSKWNLCQCYDYVYVYNGAYWKQLNKEDLKYFLGEVAVRFGYPEIDAKHHLFKDELLKQFITQAHLPAPDHDREKILINLQNGTFEFTGSNWNLKAFDPKDFLTYQLAFSYNKDAKCPMFDTYLEKVLPDMESRMILQEFSGFIFTKLNLEKCLILTGDGSNGKSVFFKILIALIGKENTLTYAMGLFNHEYNRAKLTNVLLNYSSEKGTDLNVETFKALVSGEPLQAREPYGKSFTINNKVKFIMNCNELPKETESTEAFFRRNLIIPFEVRISEAERDIDLAEKIIAKELDGVFNWLLIGLERLVKNKKFTESEKVNNALAEFKKQADDIALFIDEQGLKPSKENKRSLTDLYSNYKSFCSENNYKPLGKNKFSKKLEKKGFESTRLSDGSKGFCLET